MKISERLLDLAIIDGIGRHAAKRLPITPDEIRASFKRLEARLTAEETKKEKAKP
jgi:hypothetical protein